MPSRAYSCDSSPFTHTHLQLGEAVSKDPGYLKLRKIRAAQAIAKTLAQSQNRVYLNAGSLMLNIADKDYFHDTEIGATKKKQW